MDPSSPIPRPWELSPVLSVIQQLRHGEGALGERVRKGLIQSLGRYATNIKEPMGYFLPKLEPSSVPSYIKSILADDPSGTWAKWSAGDKEDTLGMGARAALYREMFDLPPFTNMPHPSLKKVGKKEYQIKTARYEFTEIPPPGESGASSHHVLGGVYLKSSGDRRHEFSDTWDIVTAGEERGISSDNDAEGTTRHLRVLISKFLKPAVVHGTVPPPETPEREVPPVVQEIRHGLMGRTLPRPPASTPKVSTEPRARGSSDQEY